MKLSTFCITAAAESFFNTRATSKWKATILNVYLVKVVKCLKAVNAFDPQEWFSIMMNSCGIYDSQKKD